MDITFSRALVLFVAGFTVIYLFLLLFSQGKEEYLTIRIPRGSFRVLVLITFSLSLIVSTFTLHTNWFKDSLWYIIIITALTPLIFLTIINGDKISALISLLSLQIALHFTPIPKLDMIILEEGCEMTACLAESGFWNPACAHNPNYNPFPTVASILVILSQVVGVEWYRWITTHILYYISFYIAYDLILISLTRALTDNWRISYISVYLITITPETFLHGHAYQWLGNLLNLICLYALIKILHESLPKNTSLITIAIAYSTAILTHATAMNYMLILLSMIMIMTIIHHGRRFSFIAVDRDTFKSKGFRFASNVILLILVIISSVTFIRATYTYDYGRYVIGSLVDFLKAFLSPEILEVKAYRPLYELTGVNPIQAYVWSLAIAIAAAEVFYAIFKKNLKTLDLALFTGSVLNLTLGYIYILITSYVPTTALYRGAYTAIPYIIPIASRGLYRTLKNSKVTLVVSLLILTLATPIASQDPGVNFKVYEQIKGNQVIEYLIGDYIEALTLYNITLRMYLEGSLIVSGRLYEYHVLTAARGYVGVEYKSPIVDVINMLHLISGGKLNVKMKVLTQSSTAISLIYHSGRGTTIFYE
jgi:hypothetical protein